MRIKDAEFVLGKLELTVSAPEAMRWLYKFQPDKDYDIVPHVDKRSNNANAYAWVLLGKIAQKLNIPVEQAYRHAIEEIGGATEVVSVRNVAAEAFKKAFIKGHIGRNVELIGEHDGIADLLVSYGSSDYNTKQMSQLIDSIVQDCQALGIETKDQGYIDSLLGAWE